MYKLAYYKIVNSGDYEEGAAAKEQIHASMLLIETSVAKIKLETYMHATNVVKLKKELKKKQEEDEEMDKRILKLTQNILVSHRGVVVDRGDVDGDVN
jgi:hypothetical protein